MTSYTGTSTAACSGASSTERFQADKSPYAAVKDTPMERVDMLAREILDAVHATIRKHEVTYDEYNALKAWLIQVGEDGEWPLFCDVWVEHVVEEVASAHRHGSKGTIEGPYYVPNAPELGADAALPMRPEEPGTPLTWEGTITSTDGTPLDGAKLDVWHCDDLGLYSQFSEGQPEWNLRGILTVGPDGQFKVRTGRTPAVTGPTTAPNCIVCRSAGTYGGQGMPVVGSPVLTNASQAAWIVAERAATMAGR